MKAAKNVLDSPLVGTKGLLNLPDKSCIIESYFYIDSLEPKSVPLNFFFYFTTTNY